MGGGNNLKSDVATEGAGFFKNKGGPLSVTKVGWLSGHGQFGAGGGNSGPRLLWGQKNGSIVGKKAILCLQKGILHKGGEAAPMHNLENQNKTCQGRWGEVPPMTFESVGALISQDAFCPTRNPLIGLFFLWKYV